MFLVQARESCVPCHKSLETSDFTAFGAASQIWSRRARDFIAFSIVVSLVAGVIALVAGAIVSRCVLSLGTCFVRSELPQPCHSQ